MYIQFVLPHGGSGIPAQHKLSLIKKEIQDWCTKYEVVGWSQKTIKYTHRLGFNDEKYFSLFSMTWNADFPFQIVNVANERY